MPTRTLALALLATAALACRALGAAPAPAAGAPASAAPGAAASAAPGAAGSAAPGAPLPLPDGRGSVMPAPGEKIQTFAAVLPQAWFIRRIGGPHVDVDVLVGPGQSPHTFDPTPRQMARLARARLFFAVGWPFEKRLLEKAAAVNPNLKVIDTLEGVPLRWLTPAEIAADAGSEKVSGTLSRRVPDTFSDPAPPAAPPGQAPAPAARAGQPDPHVWLSPRCAKIQAATIAKALADADPARAEEFRKNLAAVQQDLDRLDARLAAALAPLRGKTFFVYHPAFGYFADAYGLVQAPVEIEGKEPGARQLAALIARAKSEGVRVIFVQPQFSARSAEAVARAIGGAVVPIDPLAGDYEANLLDMADKIRRSLGDEAAARGADASTPGERK
ncbi:MAG: zinc ABC transporter substrate-binding protein [Planctomycetota bacterium]|nr:zinc ABC transporter substrate-binding protein [Planctomycetota bacterium]